MNGLNNAVFLLFIVLPLKLKHFCGAFKKTVLAKRFKTNRIMNSV